MNAMLLLCSLMLQLAPATPASDNLPGLAFSVPSQGTVLRAGPGADFPGVMTLDGATVVRTGELRGTFRQVFVPQGYAVYMHIDYLDLSPSDATLMVRGDRVNMRLLPSAEGLLPIAQLTAGTGPLVLLERVNDEWARVLAPAAAPLFAPDELLPASTDGSNAQRWAELHAQRELQRQAAVAGWRATDPEWQRESALLADVERMADADLAAMNGASRASRRAHLAELWASAKWERTRTLLENLRSELDQADELAAAADRATQDIRQQQRQAPTPVTAAGLDLASLRKESRLLQSGLIFKGHGDAVTRKGSVHQEGIDGAPLYTLHSTGGEILKLTAPAGVATLQALVGKDVELGGRRLFLATVEGPVLVIDKVISYRPN